MTAKLLGDLMGLCDSLPKTTRVWCRIPATGSRRGVLVGFALLTLVVGCNTPQIPLPPPVIDDLAMRLVDSQRSWIQLESRPSLTTRSASVRVINSRSGNGVIASADENGAFVTPPLPALESDQLSIDYERGSETSQVLCVVVSLANGSLSLCP